VQDSIFLGCATTFNNAYAATADNLLSVQNCVIGGYTTLRATAPNNFAGWEASWTYTDLGAGYDPANAVVNWAGGDYTPTGAFARAYPGVGAIIYLPTLPAVADVEDGVFYGVNSEYEGTLTPEVDLDTVIDTAGGNWQTNSPADVRYGTATGLSPTVGTLIPGVMGAGGGSGEGSGLVGKMVYYTCITDTGVGGVQTLVGTRIYPKEAPATSVPSAEYIVYTFDADEHFHYFGGASGAVVGDLTISCCSSRYLDSWTVAEAVRERFDGLTGLIPTDGSGGTLAVQHCHLESSSEDKVPPASAQGDSVHIVDLVFRLGFNEST